MTATHPSDPVLPDTAVAIERALSAGRAHEDAGRLLDAVVEYDCAQRLRSDADLAHRIVHLRHEAIVGGDRPWISPRFAPGDAVFFDERFVHRSSAIDGVTASRYAIESWFFATSTVPGPYVPILV